MVFVEGEMLTHDMSISEAKNSKPKNNYLNATEPQQEQTFFSLFFIYLDSHFASGLEATQKGDKRNECPLWIFFFWKNEKKLCCV